MSRQQRSQIDAMLRQPRAQPESASAAGKPPPSVEQLRSGFAAMMAEMFVPPGIRATETVLGGRPALLVEPESAASETALESAASEPGSGREQGRERESVILYFHGGGFVFGSPRTTLCLTAQLVVRTGLRAYSVDYGLAPEHPFPAGIQDTLSAYRALLEEGHDAASIVLAGDSAGGGLAVTTCLAARDAGLPMPAAIVAFSPGLDATRTGESYDTKAGADPIFTRAALDHTGAMYLAGSDPRQPLASPAILADLTGLPPMLLQVGTNELLLDDSTRMAARAVAAGVDVILDVTADVPHVFQCFAGGRLDEADQALDRAAQFLCQHVRAGQRSDGNRPSPLGHRSVRPRNP